MPGSTPRTMRAAGSVKRPYSRLGGCVLHEDGIGEVGVGEDLLDVVEVFEVVEEAEDLAGGGGVEGDGVLGEHGELGGGHAEAGLLERLAHAVEVGGGGVDLDAAVLGADVLGAGVDGDEG